MLAISVEEPFSLFMASNSLLGVAGGHDCSKREGEAQNARHFSLLVGSNDNFAGDGAASELLSSLEELLLRCDSGTGRTKDGREVSDKF